jgi:hypothetical protein
MLIKALTQTPSVNFVFLPFPSSSKYPLSLRGASDTPGRAIHVDDLRSLGRDKPKSTLADHPRASATHGNLVALH